jgi:glucan phosphoethanolaminetransferase (alkaline phosphatase superfamily)
MDQMSESSSSVSPEEYLAAGASSTDEQSKKIMIGVILGVVFIIVLTIAFIVFLLTAPAAVTTRIRDVFIIFLAIQSLLVGVVMIVLVVQLSQLINLLRNEIKPILESTNETVSNLRGTASFLSDNLVEPVMKANEYRASLSRLVELLNFSKKTEKK